MQICGVKWQQIWCSVLYNSSSLISLLRWAEIKMVLESMENAYSVSFLLFCLDRNIKFSFFTIV